MRFVLNVPHDEVHSWRKRNRAGVVCSCGKFFETHRIKGSARAAARQLHRAHQDEA